MGLEPAELARWTRFAVKGGIGKCTATCDCVAESTDDLMFLKDDEITVLLQLQDKEGCYLGYCEGVVGRFSASDVVFHSKLKKAVMTKRASTNTTLSVHSISNIPYSPTPTTPTTPTSMEASATRPSSRKMTDELLTVGGGGRSPSQNSSPSDSLASSPIPGGVSQLGSSVRARNASQDSRKSGGLQYGPTSPRGFHLGITVTNDAPEEDSAAEPHFPQVGVPVDEMSSTLSSSMILMSPSTPPPVSLGLEPLQPSSPIGKEDTSASLRPPGSLVNDHASTAPLRIVKRSPSNLTSPAQSAFSPAPTGSTLGSPNAPTNVLTQNESSDSWLTAAPAVSGDMRGESELMASSPALELQVSSEVDQREPVSAVSSSLDTSAMADSAYDDLITSHPGRFSRFSVGGDVTIPQLLGMTPHNASQPISVKNGLQDDSAPSSPQANVPSKLDGRTSISIAARGKVDEATLASTQAQVGIGLSLLQDLVGGMSSDSDSDYGNSDEEVPTEEGNVVQVGRTTRGAENGHLIGFVKAGNSRSSVTPSEGSTVQGLTYADEEEEPQANKERHGSVNSNSNSPTSPTLPPARSPPTTPPVRHQSPRSLSRYTQLQQSPESFKLPDPLGRERERRPSLATSVVSGVSGLSRKSGTSGSWDGDIYDNYRYSTFSVGSSVTGLGRSSMDSVRPRTDSVSVAGRKRLGSIGHIQDVAEDPEEMDSADLTGVETQSSNVVDTTNASFYSQDSHLSTLSKEITSLPPNDSVSRQSATVSRPSPLSIPTLEEDDHSPLLHTDWASPTSPPASTVQTALPPPTATVYTPHLRQNTAAAVPKMGLSQMEDNGTGGGEQQVTGMASILRKRLETNRQSSMPNEHSSQKEDIELNDGSVSFTSAGLGQAIVVDDDEELPSRILANGDDSELCGGDETFLESHEGGVTGNFSDSSHLKRLETDVDLDQTRPGLESPSPRTSIGRLAPLFISNRTPSPAMVSRDGGDTTVNSNSTQSKVSNPPSPSRRVLSPPSQHPSPPSSLSQRQLSSESNTTQSRPRNDIRQERQSLFLPHPNAPKPPVNAPLILEPGAGVGVISRAYPTSPRDDTSGGVPPSVPPPHSWPPVQVVIRMALSMPPRTALLGPGKSPVPILPTIYGRTEVDLASSVRPIPIIFSIDPPPLEAGRGKATAPRGAVLPRIGAGGQKVNGPSFHGSPPRRPSTQPIPNRGPPPLVNSGVPARTTSSNVPPPPSLTSEGKDKPTMDNTVAQKTETTANNLKTSPPNGSPPIPRPNFTPKAPGLRPRSRSFSGFNSSATPPPTTGGKHESVKDWPKRSASSSALSPPGLKHPAKPSRPSPLSVSSVNSSGDASQPPASPLIIGSAPTSPLARNTFVPSPPPSPLTTVPAPSSINTGHLNRSPLNAKASRPTLTIAPPPGITDVPAATSRSTNNAGNHQTTPMSIIGSKPSFEGAPKQGPFSAGIEVARQSSLRSMISLPNLKKNRTRDDDSVGVYDRDTNERRSDRPKEMVQVKHTEFELVRPNLSLQAQQRTSQDSILGRLDNSAEPRVNGLLRSESPAASLNSSDYRSPVIEMPSATTGSGSNLVASITSTGQSNESMEAHRQRETKWVSLMSSSPASLSRKSKKAKKLLVDGVPSSVRYLIWSYLTDGKGRAVKGVYEQLCQRGGVIRTRDIVVDAERLFGEGTGSDGMQYLQATKGAIIVLLQAYFSMVPDVQYTTGLTKIVGQLLLLAPEEDAFWIFTSIMDTHIRPYFTMPTPISSSASIPRSTQMEVDAALYSRALESIDPAVAKKIFVDLGILPGALCHPWFTSLFVGTLPPDCVYRVWDIFLYEGIPFLLRVALSLTIICRKFVLSATTNSESTVLATLARPPPQWLPPTPDAFLALAFGVKLKDDDIRKQRIKMGEQVKRQTQAQLSSVTLSGISLPSRV